MRPRTRILVVAMPFLAAAAVAIPMRELHPLLLYNASGSAPIGFYRIEHRTPEREETAVVLPSATLENLLSSHRLLSPGVPLLKRVIGLGGDRICRSEGVISVNGKSTAETLDRDPEGRSLPTWNGCLTLFAGQFSSSNRIPIRSTAVISGRSANARSSASRTLCGCGIRVNETQDSASPTRQSEE